MMKEGLSVRTTGRTYARPRDFNLALGIAVLATLLHTVALASELFTAVESRAIITTSTIPRLLVLIELCLLINVAGLWVRKTAGMWVSLAALLVLVVGYAGWYAYSRQIMELLSSKPFYQAHTEALPPHPLGLVGATWLNLVVLMTSGVLLVWVAKTLRAMPRGE
jgi:K+ transporter